jgi:hypothetical protein
MYSQNIWLIYKYPRKYEVYKLFRDRYIKNRQIAKNNYCWLSDSF